MKLMVVQTLSRLCFLVPFYPTHLSHRLILEHSRPIFFLECERRFPTHVKQQAKLWLRMFWIINRKTHSKECLKFNLILIS